MGYSAHVEIELFVNGQRFFVAQCGGGMLIFDEPVLLPAAEGELVLTIDGHSERWIVSLPPMTRPARIIHGQLRKITES